MDSSATEELGWSRDLLLRQDEIDAHAQAGAVPGTNTSTLDIDAIAGATGRPESVVGLHFFSAAHVMKLLEVVRGPRTGVEALVLAHTLARRMRPAGVFAVSSPRSFLTGSRS